MRGRTTRAPIRHLKNFARLKSSRRFAAPLPAWNQLRHVSEQNPFFAHAAAGLAAGGINPENPGDIPTAGAKRICVVSAILNAPNVAKACAEFRRRL
jgi:thiamine monophosphate synthase